MQTYLFVSGPVASLQFDLETDGDIVLAPSVAAIKDVQTNRIGRTLIVLVFRLNLEEFSGFFGIVDAPIDSISMVVGATAEAANADVTVGKISQISAKQIDVAVI